MDWIVAERQRLHSLFKVFFGPEVTAAVLPLTRPALRLGGEGKAVRLGGRPLLPAEADWPRWGDRPLDFLAVLDFAELSSCLQLAECPGQGRAAFYYAARTPRPWGQSPEERDGWRVFTGELAEAAPPSGVELAPARSLGAVPFLSLPAPQEPAMRRVEALYEGVLPIYEQLYGAWLLHAWPDEPVHQIGGWPVLVEEPFVPAEPEGASDEWRPVLQLDSDDRLGWHWGEPGRVFFTARSGTLDDVRLTLQAR